MTGFRTLLIFFVFACTTIGSHADEKTIGQTAAAICSGSQDLDFESTTGNAKYKDLKLEVTDAGKTLKLTNKGALLAQITDFTFAKYTECVQAMIKALGEVGKQSSLDPTEQAVSTILSVCHSRALFTRMHAELSVEAMFSSIEKCRETVQLQQTRIRSKDLQNETMELLAAVEGIERMNVESIGRMKRAPELDFDAINKLKVAALHSFRKLAESTHGSYALPEDGKLAQAFYFTQREADAPLDANDLIRQIPINPKTGKPNF